MRVQGATGKHALITQSVDESQLVTLRGNTPVQATAGNDRGVEPDTFPVEHMLLQLKRDPQSEREFAQYIDSLTDKSSRNFRHWMTAREQGTKYGPAQEDIDQITGWLQSHGFKVGYVYPNRMVIDFSGTAGSIRDAFHTEIHQVAVKGERHFANMSDPQIPAALAPAVSGVVSMHNFKPLAMHEPTVNETHGGCTNLTNGKPMNCNPLVPADFQTVYNISPLLSAGLTGQGQTVVVVEDTDTWFNDWASYQRTFGLKPYGGTLSTVHPNDAGNCVDPGVQIHGAIVEADLDVEMVTAVAPGANVELASCLDGNSLTTFGGLVAIENLVNAQNPPPIISMSYGVCEVANGAAANAAFNSAFQSAAAAGVSVFVSAGDYGASTCTPLFGETSFGLSGIGVTGWGESVYNVSVGGTDFEDVYNAVEGGPPTSTYWNSKNSRFYGSAKSYIPEIPWNNSCSGYMLYHASGYAEPYGPTGFCSGATGFNFISAVAGGGGPSNCATGAGSALYGYTENSTCAGYAKPKWQAGIFGNPADGVRDVPDVSLFAANGLWGHYIIICNSLYGSGCTGSPRGWTGVGGTSASSPMMAAIQALVNQRWGIRAGNPNPTYYSIAKSEFGSSGDSSCYSINQTGSSSNCAFYDITQGDIDVNCLYNKPAFSADCYFASWNGYALPGSLGTQAIARLKVTGPGSGYKSTPKCAISIPANLSPYLSPGGDTIYAGGTQATCTVTTDLTTHEVTGVELTNAGGGYTGVPVCTISGGGGKGATCMAVITPTRGASKFQPAFGATPGWDMATGIGSVNAYNLVQNPAW
jgi:subtilase family serine protease